MTEMTNVGIKGRLMFRVDGSNIMMPNSWVAKGYNLRYVSLHIHDRFVECKVRHKRFL